MQRRAYSGIRRWCVGRHVPLEAPCKSHCKRDPQRNARANPADATQTR
jgi:hypothetical protein